MLNVFPSFKDESIAIECFTTHRPYICVLECIILEDDPRIKTLDWYWWKNKFHLLSYVSTNGNWSYQVKEVVKSQTIKIEEKVYKLAHIDFIHYYKLNSTLPSPSLVYWVVLWLHLISTDFPLILDFVFNWNLWQPVKLFLTSKNLCEFFFYCSIKTFFKWNTVNLKLFQL